MCWKWVFLIFDIKYCRLLVINQCFSFCRLNSHLWKLYGGVHINRKLPSRVVYAKGSDQMKAIEKTLEGNLNLIWWKGPFTRKVPSRKKNYPQVSRNEWVWNLFNCDVVVVHCCYKCPCERLHFYHVTRSLRRISVVAAAIMWADLYNTKTHTERCRICFRICYCTVWAELKELKVCAPGN